MLKVFLSSTFKDLISERKAVESAVHRMSAQYIGMEHFGSFAEEPIDMCLKKVRSANVIVLVLADKYGFVPAGSLISMTEAEYREAQRQNIPVLSYFIQPEKRLLIFRDFMLSGSVDQRLVELKEEIKSKHGVSWFSSPEDLAWKVSTDLAREFSNLLSVQNFSVESVCNQLLKDPIQDRLNELISILQHRAERISKELYQYYEYAPVQKYLKEFEELHKKHIESLRDGRIIQAHEILSEIHELSSELESDEFWTRHERETPFISYRLGPNAFQRGKMICEYIAGEMQRDSKKYPWDEGFVTHDNTSPTISMLLYQKILSE